MGASFARSQHNSSTLYLCVPWIAWADIEASAKRSWKNNLYLCGNFGLHGKTILPHFCRLVIANRSMVWETPRFVGLAR
jgi:hypothetical protein